MFRTALHRTITAFILTASVFARVSQAQNAARPVGVNFEGPTDYMAAEMLIDLTKTARPFGQFEKPYENKPGSVKVDEHGWPLEDAGIVLRADRAGAAPRKFTYSFQGKADVSFFPANGVELGEPTVNTASGVVSGTFTLATAQGTIMMKFKNTNGGIRDLHVLRDVPAVGLFTKQFIDRAAPFKGKVVRFMDLQSTNGSEQTTWDKRSKPDDWNWRGTIPVEVLVELANTLESDPWFCMPHKADDDYVRQFATYVRDHLAAGRTAYVEHSNEVWNGQFAQARYAQQKGTELGLGNGFDAQLAYQGKRTAEIGRIWREVFATKPQSKLVVVLGAQSANPYTASQAMKEPGVAEMIDAVAIAPYMGHAIGPKKADAVIAMSTEAFLEQLRADINEGGEVDKWLIAYAAFCEKSGKRLIAYEAGQHLVGFQGAESNEALTKKLIEANRDPKMGALYTQYLDLWFKHSQDVICMFAFTGRPQKWGSWGLLESLDQMTSDAPKWNAVEQYLAPAR